MKRITILFFFNLTVLLILLFIVEGLSSYLYVGYKVFESQPIAERKHTEYDEELGWVNLPNIYVKDMYGPGVSLTTNSQRYRNQNEFGFEVPDGKVRIVCSGDSFTLGYGVDDDHTWCQLLTTMDDRLETVNLGQGGYGVDQAYLWFKRNANMLEHNIHIFAFITDDFRRMQNNSFAGYGKPVLTIRDGSLYQANKPVRKRAYYSPYLTTALTRLEMLTEELRTTRLLRKDTSQSESKKTNVLGNGRNRHTQEVVSMIFAELQRINKSKQSLFILVYLPSNHKEYMGDYLTDYWRKYVQREAEDKGYVFIDMVQELRSLPPTTVKELFLVKDGHYSLRGNKFVADILFQTLNTISAISRLPVYVCTFGCGIGYIRTISPEHNRLKPSN